VCIGSRSDASFAAIRKTIGPLLLKIKGFLSLLDLAPRTCLAEPQANSFSSVVPVPKAQRLSANLPAAFCDAGYSDELSATALALSGHGGIVYVRGLLRD
jgi:hypothetical protein